MNLTPVETILFLSSQLNPSEKTVETLTQLIGSKKKGIDFDNLISIAARNGVSQLVYQTFKKVENVPLEILNRFRNIYLHSSAENLRKLNALLIVLDLLKQDRIDAIPIKGALASELIFQKIGAYHGSDIDILIRPNDLEKTKQNLKKAGYTHDEHTEKDMLASHYHLVFKNSGYMIEVHWNLAKRYFNIPPAFWWQETQTVKYNEHEIICLSVEKYLIALIFRLYSHLFYPLKFFVITSELCNKHKNEIDWDLLMAYAEKFRMIKLTTFTLKLLNQLLEAKIPPQITEKKLIGYQFYKKEIVQQLLREKRKSYIGKVFYTFLLDSPIDAFGLILNRFWPSKSELRLRYQLPHDSNWVYFYYLLNIFLLPYLVFKKRLD